MLISHIYNIVSLLLKFLGTVDKDDHKLTPMWAPMRGPLSSQSIPHLCEAHQAASQSPTYARPMKLPVNPPPMWGPSSSPTNVRPIKQPVNPPPIRGPWSCQLFPHICEAHQAPPPMWGQWSFPTYLRPSNSQVIPYQFLSNFLVTFGMTHYFKSLT